MTESEYKTTDVWTREILGDLHDAGIELPDETERTAVVLANVVGSPDTGWAGDRAPSGLAASCIYVADYAVRGEDRITQTKLSKHAPVSPPTIRRHYLEIPGVFFENATPDDRDTPKKQTIAMLELFRNAQRAGVGITNVDPEAHTYSEFTDLADSVFWVKETSEQ